MRLLFALTLVSATHYLGAQELIGDSLARQPAHKIKRMAKQSTRYSDHYSAIELYEIYLKKRPKKTQALFDLSRLYHETRNYKKAEQGYASVIGSNPDMYPKAWFYRGQCLKNLGRYDSALVCFEGFKDRYRGLKDRSTFRRLLKAEMEGLAIADSLFSNPLPAKVRPMSTLNQKHTESAPLPVNEKLMYYSAISEDRLPVVKIGDSLEALPRMQIFEATLTDGAWAKKGILKGDFNDPVKHIGNPVIAPDSIYMYYTACNENWQGKTICRVYQSRKVNNAWKRPEMMGDGINQGGFTSTQPAVGRDPKRNRTILYFVSDRPGGRGGLDIWWTQYNKRDEQWSKPRNAGSKINTAGNEETPWFDLEKGTLYFSSNGHPGIGGMDVFAAVGEKSKWAESEVLGIPINSPADDIYFRKEHRDRYQVVVSNRSGSLSLWNETCCDDLYEVFYPENIDMIIKVVAMELDDRATSPKNRLEGGVANLYLFDPKTGEKFLIRSDSMPEGFADLSVDPRRTYLLEVEKPGYFTQSQLIDTRKNTVGDTITSELGLKRWDEKPITIPNVYFEFNSSDLTPESKSTIDESLYKLLVENPTITIEIAAHTDDKGSDAYNLKLSQERAQSMCDYLIKKGIEKDRLKAKGYGETQPIAPNVLPDGTDNPEGRAKNRRLEFKVTGTKLDIRQVE